MKYDVNWDSKAVQLFSRFLPYIHVFLKIQAITIRNQKQAIRHPSTDPHKGQKVSPTNSTIRVPVSLVEEIPRSGVVWHHFLNRSKEIRPGNKTIAGPVKRLPEKKR